jgi:hypothetical protein
MQEDKTSDDESRYSLITVGNAHMEEGMPYFISPDNSTNITWVGEVPEKITFELKKVDFVGGILYSAENYIVLPLDTTIKTAKDLCSDMIAQGIMSSTDYISKWDVQTQLPVPLPMCGALEDVPDDTPEIQLYPGVPYLITVTNSGSWTQK